MSLRVLLWHWGRRGGGPRYSLELARVLCARPDLEVHLSLSRQSELYADFAQLAAERRLDVDTYESVLQFGLRSLGLASLRRRFAQYLKGARIDVVFCSMDHLWNTFMTGPIRASDAKYLLTVHDATRHPGEDQPLRQWLLRRDIAASDGALVLTESVRESLIAHHGYPRERTFLSRLGTFAYHQRNEARALPVSRPPRLLFFGRILPYKGLGLLLEAFQQLEEEFPGISLEIWGTGDLTPYAGRLSALKNVKVENRWIRENEIADIFANTDLAVLPYVEASQSAVVPVAFASAMPCIATPIPGLSEQITDAVSGLIAPGMNAVDLASAIRRALRDDAVYRRLSDGALHAARTTLDWQSIGGTVADALLTLHRLGRRNARGAL